MSTEMKLAPSTNSIFEDIIGKNFYDLKSLKTNALNATYGEDFRDWLDSPDGHEGLLKYRRFLDRYLDSVCTKIIDRSVQIITERIENGDPRYDKEGVGYRHPLSAMTLSKIFSSVFDRRQLLRLRPTAIAALKPDDVQTLDDLAEALRAIAVPRQMVNVTVVNQTPSSEALS